MCNNHPKFDQDLLPMHLGVQFDFVNLGGARKIILANVFRIDAPRLSRALATGHAICSPMDTYDEARGKVIASGRAVKQWWKGEQVVKTIGTYLDEDMELGR